MSGAGNSVVDQKVLEEAVHNCDRDPIHIPGSIQGFGILLGCDTQLETIKFVSENANVIFDAKASEILEWSVDQLFNSEELHILRNALSHNTITTQRELAFFTTAKAQDFQVFVHRRDEVVIIEFVPENLFGEDRQRPFEQARRFLSVFADEGSITNMLQTALERMRAMIGYDRVKVYRFLPTGAGEVIAESRRADMSSFLGMRFPASDIPPRARKLYASTPIRVIADIYAPNVPLLVKTGSAKDLDLSLAILRGSDLVHTQYLSNMKIGGTLTVPIVVEGKLWGLFAAHNLTPHAPTASVLSAAELAGKLISLRVQHMLESKRQQELRKCMALTNKLIVVDDSELSMSTYWSSIQEELLKLVDCDGVILSINDRLETAGHVPSVAGCHALIGLVGQTSDEITAIDDLRSRLPGADWGNTAGALILKISDQPKMRLAFVRDLSTTKVTWAGAPKKDIIITDEGPKLSPRNSFDLYTESVQGKSDEWASDAIFIARALKEAMAQAVDTQKQLRDNRHRMGLMVRELNHRVRNILALVQSLSVQSRENATSIEQYATALEQRIVALSGSHNLLTRADMTGVRLGDLAELELRPYRTQKNNIKITGPEIGFSADAAPVIALLLHELTTNAVKHGALSVPYGYIDLSWQVQENGLKLNWQEREGPTVTSPTRSGFGRSIIENGIPYEFGGQAKLKFAPEGVEAEIWLPKDILIQMGEQPGLKAIEGTPASREDLMESLSAIQSEESDDTVLVVEDNFVIAVQMRGMLNRLGYKNVLTAGSVAEALACIDHHDISVCFLDVNLHGEDSFPVAKTLTKRGIPFAFASGYGSHGIDMIAEFSAPVLTKPIGLGVLKSALPKMKDK